MWFKQGACFGRVRSFEPRAVVSFAVASTGTRADSRAVVSFAVAARTPVAGRARCFIASPRCRPSTVDVDTAFSMGGVLTNHDSTKLGKTKSRETTPECQSRRAGEDGGG